MASSIALLVIDVQEDYLNQETLQPNRSESVASIESAVSAAREAGFAVAHVRTLVSAEGEAVMPHRAASRRCVIGTPGAESPIQALSTEPIFGKAFFSSFSGGQLEAWLRAQGAKQLILVGGYTHACIRETALEAYERGYSVSIVSDAIFSDRPSFALETLDWISTRAAQLVTVSDLNKLQNSTPGNLDLSPTATAQLSWAAKPIADRAGFLLGWAEDLVKQSEELARAVSEIIFKPIEMARDEVNRAIEHIRVAAQFKGFEAQGQGFSVARKPQGVIALIMPWNNPVALPVGNIAPALMSSNAVVFKPAPEAAAIGHLILESLNRASLPADLVRLVAGGASVGAALVRHPLVNAIAFTGSIQAGRSIAIAGAELFKPVRAELGGNNAAVVLADADLDVVVADLVRNVYAFAGQRCTAIRRLVVASEVRDEFVSRYIALAVQYETTKLISSDAEARVARQLELGIKQGAVVLLDGSAKLVEVVDQANVLVQQESFAPIAVLQVATNLQHAIELANGVEQGLVMSICTESDEIFEQVASQAKVGIIQRGGAVLGVSAEAPFSGWKASGVGSPEHGNWDFDFYTRAQVSYER